MLADISAMIAVLLPILVMTMGVVLGMELLQVIRDLIVVD